MTMQVVEHELILARRMARLGTETAFEVLSRAKALERQGQSIVHLEIGEPDFATPQTLLTRPWTRCAAAGRTMVPPPACPSCARPSPAT